MAKRRLTIGWVVATTLVVTVAIIFILLGFWQLNRLEQRQAANLEASDRFDQEPLPLDQLLAEANGDLESIRFRRATSRGVFVPSDEVLIRSQVHLGTAGFHVITPMTMDGNGVLVNRGWVPLAMDSPPVLAAPPTGEVIVQGWVNLTQTRSSLGPNDPEEGQLTVLNRVDVERIQAQLTYDIAQVYLVELAEGGSLPEPVKPPDFDNEGPHLAYAIQWFGFSAVLLVGYYFLARRRLR